MKRLPTILLIAGSITLILGVLPAAAVVSSVTASEVSVVAGKVSSVAGSISCTAGMKFNIRANVRDGSGNTAVGKAGGTCTGGSQPWKTGRVDSKTGFTCGEQVLVRGQARTIQDGHRRFIGDTTLQTCATGGGARDPGDILVLDTTGIATSVAQALTELGYTFTELNDQVWTDNDFSSYETVIAAMDGGAQDADDVAALRTGVIDAGQRLIFLGGDNDTSFQDGVDANLIGIQENTAWLLGTGDPDMVLLGGGTHGLAGGLPGGYDFVNPSAAFYMARPDAADHTAAAENGHGFHSLLHRDFGAGSFVWFTNSPNEEYWLNATDYAILKTIVGNSLTLPD